MSAVVPVPPASGLQPAGLAAVLLAISPVGTLLLRPVYTAGPGTITDFAWEHLNPAAQRRLHLPAQPAGSLLTHFPAGPEAGVFAFCRQAFQSGRPEHYQPQPNDPRGPYELVAQRWEDLLAVSFTDANGAPPAGVAEAPRASQAGEPAARAEAERLQTLLAEAPAGIARLAGPEQVFTFANARYCQLVGNRPLLGKTYREALPELADQSFFDLIDNVFRTGETHYGWAMPILVDRTHSGRLDPGYCDFVYQATRDATGAIDGIFIFTYEVTAQVEARQQLAGKERHTNYLNEELQAASEELLANNAELERTQAALRQLNEQLERRVQQRTEQAQVAQAEAEAQRQRLEMLLAQAPALIASLTGPQHLVELTNASFRHSFGNRELVGKPYAQALPELLDQQFITLLDQVYRTGETYHGHETLAYIDHTDTGQLEPRYFNFIYQATRDATGEVTGILIFAYDVTEGVLARRQAETLQAALLGVAQRQAQQRQELYQVLEQTLVAVVVLREPDHRIDYFNPAFEALFPPEDAEWAGRPLRGHAIGEVYPRIRKGGLVTLLDTVYRTGESQQVLDLPLAELQPGSPRYVTLAYQAYREEGEIVGVAAFIYDTTEQVLARQQREAQQAELQRIFEQAPVAITILRGPELVIELANAAISHLWGRPATSTVGRPHFEALPETAGQGFEEIMHRVLATGQPAVITEAPVTLDRAHTGQPAQGYVNFSFQPLPGPDGTPVGIICVGAEVTEQVRARQQVQSLNEELTAANEALHDANARLTRTNNELDTFVYSASHDLKSPITNIEGLLLALREQLPPPTQQAPLVARLLDMMDGAVQRFQQTLGHLTDVSRLQQLAADQPTEVIDLPALVESVRLDILPELMAAGATLTVDVAECPTVQFSTKNLRSILYNLLSNAIKYRRPDHLPVVQLRCRRQPGQFVLEVQDNGLGLDERQRARLFQLFRRLHTHVSGSGVGLYMVKKIVDNTGGTLTVQSEPGVGSTFTVMLPSPE